MLKTSKIIVSFILVFATAIMSGRQCSASESLEQLAGADLSQVEEFGEPISVTSYYDEELDATVTDRLYFIDDSKNNGDDSRGSSSGNGTFRNERTISFTSGTESTYFAQGYFVWDGSSVSVSNPHGGIYNVPSSITIESSNTSSGHGQYMGILNYYAYVTFTFTYTNSIGMSNSRSVTIRVSQSGNTI